jgi:hypothetical protein
MKVIVSSLVIGAVAASLPSAAFAGNGGMAVFATSAASGTTTVSFVVGIIVGAAAVIIWRKFRG